MAIWQFNLALIPRGSPLPIQTNDENMLSSVNEATVALARTWLLNQLGEPLSFLEDWLVYGSETGNRIDLLINPDGSAEITARIDLRSVNTSFIADICTFSELIDCELFSTEFWQILDAAPSAMDRALQQSRAAIYVRNPEGVLAQKSDRIIMR